MTDAENMNETEVRESQGSKSRLWLLATLFVVVIAITVLSFVSDKWLDKRTIRSVKVLGCTLASEQDISDLIKDSVLKKQIMNVNTSNIVKLVKENEFVADVRVNTLFNGEFQVLVTERVPIAITIDANGNEMFCDRYGEVFTYNSSHTNMDLPVIRGIIGSESFRSASECLANIINENLGNSMIISEILPGRGKDIFNIITSDYGYTLIIDGKSNLNEQLAKYYTFLSSSICANDKIKIDYIDLRWEKRLVIGKLT